MEAFRQLQGRVAPMMLDNVDTDQIIPGGDIFASGEVTRDQCGRSLFADWRYRADGSENPDFILNRPERRGATILLAGDNFGCGSSREWATTALRGFGIHVVIAAGFSSIFFNNCFRNGVLPVVLPRGTLEAIAQQALQNPALLLAVNLETQTVTQSLGQAHPFSVPPVMRRMLLDGADEAIYAERHRAAVLAFRQRDRAERAWLYPISLASETA